MLIVAGTIRLDPAKRPALEAAFDRMRVATLAEPGCLEYQAYLDRTDPGTVLIFEKWESEPALRAHFATPHLAAFGAALAAAGIIANTVQRYEVSGEAPVMPAVPHG
jgi:quinol monooxygenase YgiN